MSKNERRAGLAKFLRFQREYAKLNTQVLIRESNVDVILILTRKRNSTLR